MSVAEGLMVNPMEERDASPVLVLLPYLIFVVQTHPLNSQQV